MSGFYDDDQGLEDQMLEEVEVDDGAPLDDESEAGFDAPAESAADYIQAPDMSFVTFSGHSDSVYCAAIHPSLPGVVITGSVFVELNGGSNTHTVAYSCGISGGGDDVAYLWKFVKRAEDTATATESAEGLPAVSPEPKGEITSTLKLSGHTDTVTAVGFNFNGSLALTGGYDGAVRIWQVSNGELVRAPPLF
jgi:WD40 repeat protein